MARTDTHLVLVSNHTTGGRYSFVGSRKQCEQAAAEQLERWRPDKCDYLIEKRK